MLSSFFHCLRDLLCAFPSFIFSPAPKAPTSVVAAAPSMTLTVPHNTIQRHKSAWFNQCPANTPPPGYPQRTHCTSLIGGQVASLVNKTFIEAQLAKPVESAAAVLASCY